MHPKINVSNIIHKVNTNYSNSFHKSSKQMVKPNHYLNDLLELVSKVIKISCNIFSALIMICMHIC